MASDSDENKLKENLIHWLDEKLQPSFDIINKSLDDTHIFPHSRKIVN